MADSKRAATKTEITVSVGVTLVGFAGLMSAFISWTKQDLAELGEARAEERLAAMEAKLDTANGKLRTCDRNRSRMFEQGGCGKVANRACAVTWAQPGAPSIEMKGIAPVKCAVRDAVVWVDPDQGYSDPDKWFFKCVNPQ